VRYGEEVVPCVGSRSDVSGSWRGRVHVPYALGAARGRGQDGVARYRTGESFDADADADALVAALVAARTGRFLGPLCACLSVCLFVYCGCCGSRCSVAAVVRFFSSADFCSLPSDPHWRVRARVGRLCVL